MFTPLHTKTTQAPYNRHPSYENLFVLPYINSRLVFAELAARAIYEGQFDFVLVDLPFFLKEMDWLDIIIDLFPVVSSLVIKTSDNQFRTINFVPNDAASASVYIARRLQESGTRIEFECVDDSNVINYPEECFHQPTMDTPDDYFALTHGIGDYFLTIYEQLCKSWPTLSDEQRFFWNYRSDLVANRVNESLKRGKKTLFICNYRLWWLVNKKLLSGDFEIKRLFLVHWEDQAAVLLIQDPYFLWIKGAMDDYPATVANFFNKVREGDLSSFDKLQALHDIISDAVEEMNTKNQEGVSVRRVKIFRQYLVTRLGTHCRVTPTLSTYLHEAAVCCIGRSFARNLTRKLLEYPVADEILAIYLAIKHDRVIFSDAEFEVPDEFQQTFLDSEAAIQSSSSSDDFKDSEQQREKLVSQIRPFLKKAESESLNSDGKITWALKKEYFLHAMVSKSARQIAQNRSRTFRVVRSWGSMGDGIDWKATIRSKATGEDAIYVKKGGRSGETALNLGPFTPTVFIFDGTENSGTVRSVHDSNITQRNIELENHDVITADFPEPDLVYSIFYTRTKAEYVCENHIRKESLSAILFLCTHSWMGTERYKRIVARPGRFHCRVELDDDKDLRPFRCPDRLVAGGVKYAEGAVVVVADNTWKPSPELLDFAKVGRVRIIRVELSTLSKEVIERMRTMHFISTPLKKHPDQGTIVERFVPDLFD
jgi:hypothetical protein